MSKIVSLVIGIVVAIMFIALTSETIESTISDEEDDLYVFVLCGQSNAAYYNYDVSVANEELNVVAENTAFYYGTDTMPIYYGVRPSTPVYDTTFESYGFQDMVDDGQYVIGNIEAPFTSTFVEKTGKKIYIINTAIGGQSVSNMIEGAAGNDYAQEVFTHAMALIPSDYDVKLGALLYLQGEADSSMAVSDYKSYFEQMLSSFREFTGITPLILSETRPADGVNSSVAQLELCEELSGVYLGSTAATDFENGSIYMASDNLHYSQYGDDIIGKDLATCYVSKFYRSVADTIQLMKILPIILMVSLVVMAASAVTAYRD